MNTPEAEVKLDQDEAIYGDACQIMVEEQLRQRGIENQQVLQVMRQLPRHLFVAAHLRHQAYADSALPTRKGQSISQPFMVAIMSQCLSITSGKERILEIGTGSAYQTVILRKLASQGQIISVEREQSLADDARDTLNKLGIKGVQVECADGCTGLGYLDYFDRILVTAGACRECPDGLYQALKPEGLMVIPMGDRASQNLMCLKKGKSPEQDQWRRGLACRFVPLIGHGAWPNPSA